MRVLDTSWRVALLAVSLAFLSPSQGKAANVRDLVQFCNGNAQSCGAYVAGVIEGLGIIPGVCAQGVNKDDLLAGMVLFFRVNVGLYNHAIRDEVSAYIRQQFPCG